MLSKQPTSKQSKRSPKSLRRQPPDLYQVVIECADEAEQRELFERLRQEGRKVRLLVL